MGLAIIVGIYADVLQSDPEAAEVFDGYFRRINALLTAHGLPTHDEPKDLPPLATRCGLDSYPYSFLHHVRYAYAHRRADSSWKFVPLPDEEDPADDPVVEQQTMQMDSHLLCHSDAEGFYVPVDFEPVLFDEDEEIPGVMVGSSHRLLEELILVAPALNIRLNGQQLSDGEAEAINQDMEQERGNWVARITWLSLFEAARLSIKHRAAICFS